MNVTESIDFFLTVIENSSYWKKFKGSEVTRYIGEFVGKLSNRNMNAAVRYLQESFLSLAIKVSSILAHAESRGYIALKRIPTKNEVEVSNTSNVQISIPENTPLFSSDNNLPYLLIAPVTVAPGANKTAVVIQAERLTLSTTITQSKKFISQVLSRAVSQKVSAFDVFVTEPGKGRALWEKSNKFRNTHSSSKAYTEFYNSLEQTGIRFGNNISGKIPEADSVVEIECQMTEGVSTIAAGQALEFVGNDPWVEVITITTGKTLVVGSEREDIESVRNNALYYPTYDNNAVLDGDYAFFIRTNVRGLTWFSIWGEAAQEKLKDGSSLDYINKVYIAAYHPGMDQAELMASIGELCSAKLSRLNNDYVPVIAKTAPFTINLQGKVNSTKDLAEVEQQIRAQLNGMYSDQADTHNGAFSEDGIYGTVKSLSVLMRFKITVSTDLDQDVPIDTFRYMDVAGSTINLSY